MVDSSIFEFLWRFKRGEKEEVGQTHIVKIFGQHLEDESDGCVTFELIFGAHLAIVDNCTRRVKGRRNFTFRNQGSDELHVESENV